MQCEACHGSSHAEFPTWTRNDNITSKELQRHKGKLSECTACHATMPNSVTGGPHGLHPMGQSWVSAHPDVVDNGGAQTCQSCHGSDYRGTDLSRACAARIFAVEDGGTKTFAAGQTIGCYDCHNGPGGGDGDGKRATGGSLILAMDQPKGIDLRTTGSRPLTVRIVSQPEHGTVGLQGAVATYFSDPGYVGSDMFTFAASNGFVESNLSTTNIRVAGLKSFWRGQEISCYECHDGSNSSNPTTRTCPTIANATLAVPAGQSASLTLSASGAGSVVRILRQPNHGTVALTGRVATYFAEAGYIGPDNFASSRATPAATLIRQALAPSPSPSAHSPRRLIPTATASPISPNTHSACRRIFRPRAARRFPRSRPLAA